MIIGGLEKNALKKIASGFLTAILLISSVSMSCLASEKNDENQQIMVSMGDSYSSGEGIERFYGQNEPVSKRVNNPDWLAHRSEKAWSGMLSLPTVDGVMSDKKNKNWFFVAASGATTQNIKYNFIKEYDKSGYKGSYSLDPQLKVFDELGQNKADYVTLTLGGNDVDFSGTILQCVLKSSHLNPSHLSDKLNNTWKDFFAQGGVRDKLYDVYEEIAEKAGSQAQIIVAGYPKLLDPAGVAVNSRSLSFSEAIELNRNVSKFNRAIESIVSNCQGNGMKICFVSVEDAFEGHGAYSFTDTYINPIYIPSKDQDLKFSVASSYSIHPNEDGAKAYARCVQAKIDELERVTTTEETYNPSLKIFVYSINDDLYDDYDINIVGKEFNGWFKWGWFKKDYSKSISVDTANDVSIQLPQGDYTITVTDRAGEHCSYQKDILIRSNSKNKSLSFRTSFGQMLLQENDSKEEAKVFDGNKTSGERNIVLTLDVSGSMAGTPLTETKKAAFNFVNTVLEQDAGIGIVTYDEEANIASGFSGDRANLQSIISDLYDGGGTNIEAGLRDAQWMLEKTNAKKKIIVLMSDGEPNEGLEGEELIQYANEIKQSGIIIYTIGFFESLGDRSYPQYLMEHIASDGCHYEVANADELVFFFEDMADQINGQKYIYVRIACPVDVSVTYGGEILDSSEKNLNARTSFGTLTFEENRQEMDENLDDRVKVLRLKDGVDYDLELTGTGHGIMNYTIGFMDDNGDYSDLRKFENIKITRRTKIDTIASNADESILKIDENGDGKYDLKLRAGVNGNGEEVKIPNWILIIGVAALVFVAIIGILICMYVKQKKKRKGE